jgi:uracil-DNA glycosylase family 4
MSWEKIKSIKKTGQKHCYDISLEARHKGFVANGIQVHNSSFTIEDAFDTFEDGIKFKNKYPEIADLSMKLEGQVRGMGVHAAAVVVCEEDLYNTAKAHLRADKEGNLLVNWEKEDAEYCGLMKLDILGLKALTVLSRTAKLVKENHGVTLDYYSLPLDDEKVYHEFGLGHTVGIFQFGSLGLRKLCQELKVDSFNILVDTNALFRPGTLRTGMVTEYTLRKTGQKTYEYKHPFIEEMTKDTFGIILYQEQVMKFMYELGGLEWKTADTVRKVISKSKGVEQFMKFKDMFVDGCEKRKTLDRKTAGELWEELASFGSYGFNRCISRTCTVLVPSGARKAPKKITIEEAYNSGVKEIFIYDQKEKKSKVAPIKKIYKTGQKEVFEVICRNNRRRSIKTTADHKFLTEHGWKRLGDLSVGDKVMMKLPATMLFGKENPGSHNSSDHFRKIRSLRKESVGVKKDLRGILSDFSHNPFGYVEIEGIYPCGTEQTYDIEIDDPEHNYLANMFVVHNSHAVAYSMIAYYEMWSKIYYPAEFVAASLTCGSETRKEDVVEEAQRIGLIICPPKIGLSKASEWVVKGHKLYVPFDEIKGVGDKTSLAIEKYCDNKLYSPASPEIKINARIKAILDKVGVFEPDRDYTDEELEDLNPFFSFSIIRDPMRKYRSIRETFKENLDLKQVKQATDRKFTDKEFFWYFGQMTEIKYGYRASIAKLQSKAESLGHADALGGVYGNFKDDTDFIMLVFDADIYNKKKDVVEHCGGEFVLINARHTGRNQNLMCRDMYTAEELMAGDFDIKGLDLIHRAHRFRNPALLECTECNLREGCTAPVFPSSGLLNAMIVGEAPGKDENRLGKGFMGSAGDVLWRPMTAKGLTRDLFHITNVAKCWPNEQKTPNKKHVAACSHWLDEEIKATKPALIYALGNTCMRFFKQADSGIMEMSGKTEWNAKYGCWICWGIHPATVLYHKENLKMFTESVDNFANMFKKLGG